MEAKAEVKVEEKKKQPEEEEKKKQQYDDPDKKPRKEEANALKIMIEDVERKIREEEDRVQQRIEEMWPGDNVNPKVPAEWCKSLKTLVYNNEKINWLVRRTWSTETTTTTKGFEPEQLGTLVQAVLYQNVSILPLMEREQHVQHLVAMLLNCTRDVSTVALETQAIRRLSRSGSNTPRGRIDIQYVVASVEYRVELKYLKPCDILSVDVRDVKKCTLREPLAAGQYSKYSFCDLKYDNHMYTLYGKLQGLGPCPRTVAEAVKLALIQARSYVKPTDKKPVDPKVRFVALVVASPTLVPPSVFVETSIDPVPPFATLLSRAQTAISVNLDDIAQYQIQILLNQVQQMEKTLRQRSKELEAEEPEKSPEKLLPFHL